MKKTYILLLIFSAIIFGSCEKSETFDTSWKLSNENAFTKTESNPDFTKLNSISNNGYVLYKKIKDGKTGKKPLFTDKVKVLYTGWYKNIWEKDDYFKDENGNKITNKIIFDSTSNRSDIPSEFNISTLVDGFSTALQNMEVGDKWEVWIPWKLGYGAQPPYNSEIRGYTTLVFEIELVEIL